MRLADFHYDLPEELIAQVPSEERGAGRLLCLDGRSGEVRDRRFRDLVDVLRGGDLLVFNDTRVMQARLFGRKESGGRLEILVERVLDERRGLVHIRASKAPRAGSRIRIADTAEAAVTGRQGDLFEISLETGSLHELMEHAGEVPLPPYIRRAAGRLDRERYQTVYASRPGAVAAPTAGLHFDEGMLARLEDMGVDSARITLHVGAGTFQPVRCERLDDHVMHREYVEVSQRVVDQVRAARERGGRVVAVGTTSVRALETASQPGELRPFCGDTRLFIRPGYRFVSIDALITNFHLPESTLLMLVCAFAGYHRVIAAYRHAVAQRYRFFSYGDAMFVTRGEAA